MPTKRMTKRVKRKQSRKQKSKKGGNAIDYQTNLKNCIGKFGIMKCKEVPYFFDIPGKLNSMFLKPVTFLTFEQAKSLYLSQLIPELKGSKEGLQKLKDINDNIEDFNDQFKKYYEKINYHRNIIDENGKKKYKTDYDFIMEKGDENSIFMFEYEPPPPLLEPQPIKQESTGMVSSFTKMLPKFSF